MPKKNPTPAAEVSTDDLLAALPAKIEPTTEASAPGDGTITLPEGREKLIFLLDHQRVENMQRAQTYNAPGVGAYLVYELVDNVPVWHLAHSFSGPEVVPHEHRSGLPRDWLPTSCPETLGLPLASCLERVPFYFTTTGPLTIKTTAPNLNPREVLLPPSPAVISTVELPEFASEDIAGAVALLRDCIAGHAETQRNAADFAAHQLRGLVESLKQIENVDPIAARNELAHGAIRTVFVADNPWLVLDLPANTGDIALNAAFAAVNGELRRKRYSVHSDPGAVCSVALAQTIGKLRGRA